MSCRNHGSCPICKGNRTIQNQRAIESIERGLERAASGLVHDIGSFEQFAEDFNELYF